MLNEKKIVIDSNNVRRRKLNELDRQDARKDLVGLC